MNVNIYQKIGQLIMNDLQRNLLDKILKASEVINEKNRQSPGSYFFIVPIREKRVEKINLILKKING
jgi:hypothetical protein